MKKTNPRAAMAVAIIGGGFSGAITAVHLLREAGHSRLEVTLIERRPRTARGLAYSTSDDNLLLNVPAGNMSALPDEPEHFLEYCRAIDPSINSGSFVSRRIYGDYLEHTLQQAERASRLPLTHLHADVVAVRRCDSSARFRLELADGATLTVDRVVLALGYAGSKTLRLGETEDDIGDGWSRAALEPSEGDLPIAIAGSGLTAIDTVFRLTSQEDSCRLVLISRHGYLPHEHRSRPQPPVVGGFPAYLEAIPATALAHLRAVRREVVERSANGGDWRDVINELRPHTPDIWQRLPVEQRRRFLGHIASCWDIHRHRLAPLAGQRLRGLIERGQLEILAGRIQGLERKNGALQIAVRERATGRERFIEASTFINCTGPNYDVGGRVPVLFAQLRDEGYLCADALKTGLEIDDDYRPVGRDGKAVDGLFYVGPMLRTRYWEATAVPELRVHVRQVARQVIKSF